MADELIRKLRSCGPAERRSVAMELAQEGTDEAVTELMRMVDGERRRFWFRYTLDDQLTGVEALGETGRKEALDYLKNVYKEVRGYNQENWDEPQGYHVSCEEETYDYPNAKGELKSKLSFTVITHAFIVSISPEDAQKEYAQKKEGWPHNIVRGAIAKLEGVYADNFSRPATQPMKHVVA